jgi:hypothetical protein
VPRYQGGTVVRLFSIILFLLLNVLYFYFEMPVLALGFVDWSNLAIVWGMLFLFVSALMLLSKFRAFIMKTPWGELIRQLFPQVFKERPHVVNISNYQNSTWAFKKYKTMAVIGVGLMVMGIGNAVVLPLLTSAPLFYSQAYRNLLGQVKESSFSKDIEPINLSQIRIVDEETARKLADKKIGEVPALGSEVQLGDLVLQKVKDKLYYVAPLEYRGFFQWLSNRDKGSKGYVMVSATNPDDVRLIQNVHLKYQMRGFFMDYLPRYLYFHGYVNVGLTDYSFQVDNNLRPYWVVTLYRNKVGYRGSDAIGVVTVDAQTGEIARYRLNNMPSWVNRVQPEEFIYQQIRDWGEYINGFWNSIFAKTGTLEPTGRKMHLIYGNDDNVYWYTGITSSGKDKSTVGFILVNSRTKEAKWYKVAGADENSAKKSAEGQVQEKGYKAGYPVLYNIYGVPTYIAPLKDKEGLLKAVAFISVENYNLVGVGPDIESALRSYQQSLSNKGNQFVPSNKVSPLKIQGKIAREAYVVKNGESYFYLMLEGDKRIFVGTAAASPKLPLAKAGDTVTINASDPHDNVFTIREFKCENY